MAGPWEKYQQPAAGPWEKYSAPSGAAPDFSNAQGSSAPTVSHRKPSFADRLRAEGRGLGLGARSVVQGLGSLIGAGGGDAFNAFVMPGEQPSYRDAASGLADLIGLPSPQDSRERILGDVGEALSGTAATLGAGGALNLGRTGASLLAGRGAAAVGEGLPTNLAINPGLGSRAAEVLTTQPAVQALSATGGSAASGAVREGGGGTGAQLAAGVAGGMGPGLTGALGGAATRGLVRGGSGDQMGQTIADFAALGATPSVGQASGNRVIQGLENMLGGAPTSAGVVSRFVERQADDIGTGLRNIANNTSRNASAERAGRAIEKGAETFSGNVGAQRKALYWQADQHIPPGTGTPMKNTVAELTRLTTPDPGAAATSGRLVNPRLQQMMADLQQDLQANGGTIPYESLRKLRTAIGEEMNDFSMTADTPARQLSGLYRALSMDMMETAQGLGPRAVQAARRANTYTRASAERLEQVQRVIDKNGGPEAVYNATMQGARDGGTTLRAVMQSLPEDGQKAVTAAVIRRMGLATPGAQDAAGETFSAATFLTNWNRVSPEAKRALFDRYGPQYSRDMDQIARVAENIKNGSKVLANPSGTANRAAALTYGASLVGSLFTGGTGVLIAGGAGANLAARLLTNPTAVRWLARSTTAPVGSTLGGLASLRNIAHNTGDQELAALAEELSKIPENEGSEPD